MNDGPIPPRLEQDASELLDRLSDLCPEASPVHLAEWREKLRRYICLLYAWSRRTNLVSEKDRLRLASHHLLPSLAMRSVLLRFHHGIVADVGSGSGLPGVPLKISLPEIPFQLIEARRRRANFLKEVTRQLNLQQVEVVNDRVEEWVCPQLRKPEIIVSRATMAAPLLARCCAGLLKPGGHVLFTLASDTTLPASERGESMQILDTGVEDSEGRPIRVGILTPPTTSAA